MREQKTIADIIAEKRREANYIVQVAQGKCHTRRDKAEDEARDMRREADCLEAAHKREVDVLKQRCAELNAEVAAKDEVIKRLNDAISEEQRRKMATADCAKLREALTKVKEWMARRIATGGFEFSATFPTMLEDVVLPALATPRHLEAASLQDAPAN